MVQPPYAPELNPVDRFFQELRQALGDRVYPPGRRTRRGCGNCAAGAGSGTP